MQGDQRLCCIMYESFCWIYLELVHIDLPECDITDDSLLNVRVCVLCILTPASFISIYLNYLSNYLSCRYPYQLTRM